MPRFIQTPVLVSSFFILVQATASAQTPSLFLGGSAGASVERESQIAVTPHESLYPELDGTAGAGTVAAGAFLTRRISVRAEFTFRGELKGTATWTAAVLTPNPTTYSEKRTLTDLVRTGAVLLAYHARSDKRVRIEYIGGLAFVYQRRKLATETTISGPSVPPPIIQSTEISYGTIPVVGLDVPVRVKRHVDVVPQIRVQSISGLTIAPGIGARVSF